MSRVAAGWALLGALLSAFLLTGCDTRQPPRCGIKFCLPEEAKLLSQREIVDFKFYQIEWNGQRFGIYEGNHPDFGAGDAQTLSIAIDPASKLSIRDGRGDVLARLGDDWQRYLHVSGPCSTAEDCALAELASRLVRS